MAFVGDVSDAELAAYYRAERRGFAPGGEVEDWIEAEREVAARISESRAQ